MKSDTETLEQKHFDTIASVYDKQCGYDNKFTQYKIHKKVDYFIRLIRQYNDKPLRILELGCGTGEYTAKVADLLPTSHITGIDISQEMLTIAEKKCRKHHNIKFLQQSVYATKLPSGHFDIIFGFYILHHLNEKKVYKEVLRLLKPGGMLFFYEPNILNPIVFLIKSIPYLKKKVADSENEWAVNPLTIKKIFTTFSTIQIATTEFILPLHGIPTSYMKGIDKICNNIQYIPFLNLFGGSVFIFLQKKN